MQPKEGSKDSISLSRYQLPLRSEHIHSSFVDKINRKKGDSKPRSLEKVNRGED